MNSAEFSRSLGIQHNVAFNVYDENTGKLLQHHQGHNCATNSLLMGIAHYLAGDGIFNQAYEMLRYWVPQYISLGTMGLTSQEEETNHLPVLTNDACIEYMEYCPGYTADGYDEGKYNSTTVGKSRAHLGLGPMFGKDDDGKSIDNPQAVDCELISSTHHRSKISYREVVPESYAELPYTVDITLSAMISTGALAEFRDKDKKYIFISEAGLWSNKDYVYGGDNGFLAGYRIVPPNTYEQVMDSTKVTLEDRRWYYYITHDDISKLSDVTDLQASSVSITDVVNRNRTLLKSEILRVGFNQVVQVIWKIQIGDVEHLQRVYAEELL